MKHQVTPREIVGNQETHPGDRLHGYTDWVIYGYLTVSCGKAPFCNSKIIYESTGDFQFANCSKKPEGISDIPLFGKVDHN